ncbi:MAG: hypothetical protein OS130_06540 [Thermodesulfobacteriota bacterium]|jgi:tRNA(Ile)-lysidine synthase TilS/MesJ|nr:MAG: hypothetical protein OS130_06540 [Thermodesulfobacteriota bacterium]
MKKWVFFISIILGLVLGGWAGYYYWQGTPRCSLYRMAKAIKNNDPQTFLSYIDMDQVVEGMLDSTIKKVRKKFSPNSDSDEPAQEESSPKDKRFNDMVAQLTQSLKPALEQQLTRAFQNIEQRDRISPLAAAFLSHVKREGDKAQVTMKVSKKDSYQCTMEKTPDGFWKVVSINVDFFKLYKKARKHKDRND